MEPEPYLQPLREEMARVEQAIQTREAELVELRRKRTTLGHALRGLDPQWAANHKSKSKKKDSSHRVDGSYAIADEKLETILAHIREHHAEGTFTASELPLSELGMGFATRSQALRVLQERGSLRLDSVKGRMKFFALNA